MLAAAISICLHPVWLNIFFIKYDLGVAGIAISGTITNVLTFLLTFGLLRCQKHLRPAVHMIDSGIFIGMKNYLAIGGPYIFVNLLDFWSWEFQTLACGYVGAQEQASQVLLV